MTRTRTIVLLTGAAVVALVALIIAGCGGGGSGAGANASKAAVNVSGATIGVARGGLGNILVDSHGRTLYLFKKDSGAKSTCFGECAHDWPPLRAVGKPTTASGAKASLVAST